MSRRPRRSAALAIISLGVASAALVDGRRGLAQDNAPHAKVTSQITAPNISAALAQGNAPGLNAVVKGTRTTSVFNEALQRGLRDPGLQRSSTLRPKLTAAAAAAVGGGTLLQALSQDEVEAAVKIGLEPLTGLRPPKEGLAANAMRSGGQQVALADTPRQRLAGDPDPSQSVGDWRIPLVMMSVSNPNRPDDDQRHQNRSFDGTKYTIPNDCGSCWAFGTVAAFEHAYVVRYREYINISEQEILSFADPGYNCNGGWWAFDYLLKNAISSESLHRYVGAPNQVPVKEPRFKASRWGYVTTATNIPSVPELKAALCEYGPLAVSVRATPKFSNYIPGQYPDGVFSENDPNPINHAVLLVGWDDVKGGGSWVIRNSWGGDWGENGFMRISYTTNSIGYGAAWVVPDKGTPAP